jgi:hypothetical protein
MPDIVNCPDIDGRYAGVRFAVRLESAGRAQRLSGIHPHTLKGPVAIQD